MGSFSQQISHRQSSCCLFNQISGCSIQIIRSRTTQHPRTTSIVAATSLNERSGSFRHGVSHLLTLVRDADLLLPANPAEYNIALEIWKALNELSVEERREFTNRLSTSNMQQLWRLSASRYKCKAASAEQAMGANFSLRDFFPDTPGEVAVFDGRAGVPVLKGFKKLFFRHPTTDELYGHVDVGYWPLGAFLYPLFFRCKLGVEIFPGKPPANRFKSGTSSPTDMQLEYQDLGTLDLGREAVPSSLPTPKEPMWPFSGLTDYMRPIGPQIFVGRGLRQPKDGLKLKKASNFLYFVLIKSES